MFLWWKLKVRSSTSQVPWHRNWACLRMWMVGNILFFICSKIASDCPAWKSCSTSSWGIITYILIRRTCFEGSSASKRPSGQELMGKPAGSRETELRRGPTDPRHQKIWLKRRISLRTSACKGLQWWLQTGCSLVTLVFFALLSSHHSGNAEHLQPSQSL